MKPFNQEVRNKQLEYLDRMDSREGLNSSKVYMIKGENGKVESCQCAGTASMVLETEFPDVNVWIDTGG